MLLFRGSRLLPGVRQVSRERRGADLHITAGARPLGHDLSVGFVCAARVVVSHAVGPTYGGVGAAAFAVDCSTPGGAWVSGCPPLFARSFVRNLHTNPLRAARGVIGRPVHTTHWGGYAAATVARASFARGARRRPIQPTKWADSRAQCAHDREGNQHSKHNERCLLLRHPQLYRPN